MWQRALPWSAKGSFAVSVRGWKMSSSLLSRLTQPYFPVLSLTCLFPYFYCNFILGLFVGLNSCPTVMVVNSLACRKLSIGLVK